MDKGETKIKVLPDKRKITFNQRNKRKDYPFKFPARRHLRFYGVTVLPSCFEQKNKIRWPRAGNLKAIFFFRLLFLFNVLFPCPIKFVIEALFRPTQLQLVLTAKVPFTKRQLAFVLIDHQGKQHLV